MRRSAFVQGARAIGVLLRVASTSRLPVKALLKKPFGIMFCIAGDEFRDAL